MPRNSAGKKSPDRDIQCQEQERFEFGDNKYRLATGSLPSCLCCSPRATCSVSDKPFRRGRGIARGIQARDSPRMPWDSTGPGVTSMLACVSCFGFSSVMGSFGHAARPQATRNPGLGSSSHVVGGDLLPGHNGAQSEIFLCPAHGVFHAENAESFSGSFVRRKAAADSHKHQVNSVGKGKGGRFRPPLVD